MSPKPRTLKYAEALEAVEQRVVDAFLFPALIVAARSGAGTIELLEQKISPCINCIAPWLFWAKRFQIRMIGHMHPDVPRTLLKSRCLITAKRSLPILTWCFWIPPLSTSKVKEARPLENGAFQRSSP